MFKRLPYIILLLVQLFSIMQAFAQIAMPDTVCVGTARLYHVNDATKPSTYTWKINGITQTATTNEISITWPATGTFLLSVQEHGANGCDGDIRSGLVYIIQPPVANAGPDASICFGTNIQLNGSGGTIYQWSPSTYLSNQGIANPVATIPLQGIYKYFLTVSSGNGCSSSDTVVVTVANPLKVFAGTDTSIAINQPLQLKAADVNNSGFTSYSWSPPFGLSNSFIQNPVAILDRNTTYIITAKTPDGCVARDDINVKVFASADIYVPTAFTPNKDGLNDILRPVLIGIKELKHFAVYNRYGERVYITSTAGTGWNGMVKGKMQNSGAYIWEAEAEDFKGNMLVRKGMAVLVK